MDDEDDGSAVDATATDEDSSESGLEPWDSTVFASGSNDELDGEDAELSDGTGEESANGEGEDDEGEGNVAGALAPDVPVEPGRPEPVNALFVVFGAYLGVVAIASLLGAGGTFTLVEYVAVTVGFFALSGLVYGFLARGNPDT